MGYKEEKRECQNCKGEFIIEPEDFSFYEKIKVPPPTFCPECRMIRRMFWRNTRNLYKRKSSEEIKNDIISVYSKDKIFKVYDQKFWWSDKWDSTNYGRNYDFNRTFFEQFRELLEIVPQPNVSNINPINSLYVNVTLNSKNCYLIFSSSDNEDCMYSEGIKNCKNSIDLLNTDNCENSYQCVDCEKSFNLYFGQNSSNCIDSMFLYDCKNCSNCIGCFGLRNKKYYIFNKQYTEKEYFKKVEEFNLNKYNNLKNLENIFKKDLLKFIRKFANITGSNNVSGESIRFSNNCKFSFEIKNANNSKFIWRLLQEGSSDNYDITIGTKPELCYECTGAGDAYNSKFVTSNMNMKDCAYTFSCLTDCSNCFGCVGLRNKSYCILNKQYTKEEYEELVPKIIKHMNDMPYISTRKNPSTSRGQVYKYGEFFPPELSPFCYNETIAQEYYPLTKEEAIRKGYRWKDKEERNYNIDIYNKDIPDDINEVDESIINKVIECTNSTSSEQGNKVNEQTGCTEAFKIIEPEFQFYKRMNLPIPRLCPNCRHYNRLKQRNPLKLWHRKCMKGNCTNEFETSYAPDRPEIIYCEECYKKEIY